MSEEVTIKKKRGRPPGATKKIGAAKKKAAKKKPKKVKEPELEDSTIDFDIDEMDKDLELLNADELSDENIRAMIRARNQQAKKQQRLNEVAMGSLVEKEMALDSIKTVCLSLNEKLSLFPDKMVSQLHKRTKIEIREKLVKEVDSMKKEFIDLIEKGL